MDMDDGIGDFYEAAETVASETTKKVEKILRKLLEPDINIKNDLYLNLLLTQWANKTENGTVTKPNPKLNELFFQWIVEASNRWTQETTVPSTPVLLFALRVCCQLNSAEDFFVKMKANDVFRKLAEISRANKNLDSGITVGFITLLSSVLEYAIGVEWLLTTTYWNEVIVIALKGQTKYIKKKAYQLIIKILETTVLLDQKFCEELVEVLVEPLVKAAERAEDLTVENSKLYKSLKPWLDLIFEVADTLLKKFNKNVLKMFYETEISEGIQYILNFSQEEDFSFDLLKIRFVFLFYQLCVKLEDLQQPTHDEDTLSDIKIMFELIQAEIEKDHGTCVLKICHYALVLYYNLDTHIPICIRKGESIEFQNQMMLFLLVPVMTFSCQLLGKPKAKQLKKTDDLRYDFNLKFVKISAIKTIELIPKWESRLLDGKEEVINYISVCLPLILKSKKILNKEQAAFIFRPLTYVLKDLIVRLDIFQNTHMPPSGIKFFTIIIDTIIDLVESFDLTWKDSIETLSMLDLVYQLVQYEYVDNQLTVKFLQLLNMAISRCMSPSMILLMDTTDDSVIHQIGSILYTKCHNKFHQIRNNALQVIHTLALNAKSKFPEFTIVLFNYDLPQMVLEMALHDEADEVRATSIRCIQALLHLEDIWDVYQSDKSFWDNILNILVNEPKGTVRKEAAILVHNINVQYGFPEDLLPRLYDVMTHAAIGDIHWEVKCSALSFWASTIQAFLKEQGMTDRGFPTHTFSKEKKKIITLTEAEIRRREIKVLNQLSEIGCLYVLKTAVQDKFNEEVSKTAMNITTDLIMMFKTHKINDYDIDLDESAGSKSSSEKSGSANPMSPDTHSSPDRRFSLESSQSQFLDSPYSEQSSFSPTSVDFFDTENHLLMLESDVDIGVCLEENNMENPICDIAETEKLFEDLLKLNDATLLEEIYNPQYQGMTTAMVETKKYIPPSEYVRFCLKIAESNEKKSIQSKQNRDEFDLLLDDLLKEYDLDAAT